MVDTTVILKANRRAVLFQRTKEWPPLVPACHRPVIIIKESGVFQDFRAYVDFSNSRTFPLLQAHLDMCVAGAGGALSQYTSSTGPVSAVVGWAHIWMGIVFNSEISLKVRASICESEGGQW